MPPKTKYSRQTIVNAAFDIAKEHGFSGITARSVVKELKCSVAPIYVNFATIDDLVKAVVKKVFAISEEMLPMQDGQSMFEKIGRASIAFANQYPVLFRELSMQPNPYMASYEMIENNMLKSLQEDSMMQDWALETRKRLLLKMWIFMMGLSVMVANRNMPSWLDESDFDGLLLEVGEEILLAQEVKSKNDNK